ncbi:MAG: hypothetical protein KAK00_07495 [Nanoarchaeota archaeon]|nr:hypothetical protein [Nanoarchaeota archaeon]
MKKLDLINSKFFHRQEIRYCILYLVISVLFLIFFLGPNLYSDSGSSWSFIYSLNNRYAWHYNQLPFWMPEVSSGTPYLANPEYPFLDAAWLISLFVPYPPYNINITIAFYLFLSMVGTFFLLKYITKGNLKVSFIAGLSIVTSGFYVAMIGMLPFTNSMAFIPFALLFLIKALNDKDTLWLKNTILCSLFLSLIIFSGGISNLIWFLVVIPLLLFLASLPFGGFKEEKFLKIILVFIILMVITIGLSAAKLLPDMEYINEGGSRTKQPYTHFIWAGGISDLISNSPFSNLTIKNTIIRIGIIELLIISAGIVLILKKKPLNYYFIFSIAGIILAFLIAADTFIDKLLYSIPLINSLRGVSRVMVLLPFFSAILIGIGYDSLIRKKKLFGKRIVFISIIVIMLIELFFVFPFPKEYIDRDLHIMDSELIKKIDELTKTEELFRVHKMKESFVGSGICPRIIYNPSFYVSDWCSGNGWYMNYVIFTTIAENGVGNKPINDVPSYLSKMRGILNDKYIISPINLKDKGIEGTPVSSLNLIGNYSDFPTAYGYSTHIYENERFLPRFYVADKATLLYGKSKNFEKPLYSLLQEDLFDPKSSTLVLSGSLKPELIDKYDLILLIDKSYELHPDYFRQLAQSNPNKIFPRNSAKTGSSVFGVKEILSAVNNVKGNITPVKVDYYSPNKIILTLPDNISKGHLVASETFYQFDGWNAKIGSEKFKFHNTFNVISSFYFENPQSNKVVIKYLPVPFVIGGIISLITFIICLLLFFKKNHS